MSHVFHEIGHVLSEAAPVTAGASLALTAAMGYGGYELGQGIKTYEQTGSWGAARGNFLKGALAIGGATLGGLASSAGSAAGSTAGTTAGTSATPLGGTAELRS